ncbi:hypothetical protein H1C71_002371, partial [Ictidomys tridecemlineatus]
ESRHKDSVYCSRDRERRQTTPPQRPLPRRQQLQQRQLRASRPQLGLLPSSSSSISGQTGKTLFKFVASTFSGAKNTVSGNTLRPTSFPRLPPLRLSEDSQVLLSSGTLLGG